MGASLPTVAWESGYIVQYLHEKEQSRMENPIFAAVSILL